MLCALYDLLKQTFSCPRQTQQTEDTKIFDYFSKNIGIYRFIYRQIFKGVGVDIYNG